MSLLKRAVAEFIGTFWLVFAGCGAYVLAAVFAVKLKAFDTFSDAGISIGIGLVGVSLAFGLAVLSMAYAIGHISGCHLNPAVSIGLWTAGRFPSKELWHYILAQVAGAIVAAGALALIASGRPDFNVAGTGLASNGYTVYGPDNTPLAGQDHSPGHYGLVACVVAEVLLTCFFVLIILNATDKSAPAGFGPLAIGLGLTAIHLVGIPVTNLSVNPARSTGTAVIVAVAGELWPVMQLWLFWVAPIVGAVLAGLLYRWLSAPETPVHHAHHGKR
jgi:aquaporin Z